MGGGGGVGWVGIIVAHKGVWEGEGEEGAQGFIFLGCLAVKCHQLFFTC